MLDCGNSGTSMRVLSGVLAGRPFLSILSGDASLNQRPMRRVVEPLRAMGALLDGRADGTLAPLVIRGGELHGVRHELPVASAQVKSALMLAGLQADGVTEIVSPAVSRDHSERMLAALGVPIEVDGLCVRVRPGAPEPFELEIPGDPSSAAFFVVGALHRRPGPISSRSRSVSVEPDAARFRRSAAPDGCRHRRSSRALRPAAANRSATMRACARAHSSATTIAGDEMPSNVQDEVPALAIAAAFADGVTEVRNAGELAAKESNRIGVVAPGHAVRARAWRWRRALDGLVIREQASPGLRAR